MLHRDFMADWQIPVARAAAKVQCVFRVAFGCKLKCLGWAQMESHEAEGGLKILNIRNNLEPNFDFIT